MEDPDEPGEHAGSRSVLPDAARGDRPSLPAGHDLRHGGPQVSASPCVFSYADNPAGLAPWEAPGALIVAGRAAVEQAAIYQPARKAGALVLAYVDIPDDDPNDKLAVNAHFHPSGTPHLQASNWPGTTLTDIADPGYQATCAAALTWLM